MIQATGDETTIRKLGQLIAELAADAWEWFLNLTLSELAAFAIFIAILLVGLFVVLVVLAALNAGLESLRDGWNRLVARGRRAEREEARRNSTSSDDETD